MAQPTEIILPNGWIQKDIERAQSRLREWGVNMPKPDSQTTALYAVFKDGFQVSKAQASLDAAVTEAFKIGVVHAGGGRALVGGYEIRECK